MSARYLLRSLICLGWLLAAGCAPVAERVVTVPATRPAPAGTPPPDTPTTTPTAIPVPTRTPTFPEMLATETARAAAYTPPPTLRPTSTRPATPTFTPIPGPVWRILFRAVPCPIPYDDCSNDLYMSNVSRWYLINSDGSGLVALEDTETFLVDQWGYPHLSSDGTHLAYLSHSETDDELHVMLSEISSGQASDLGVAPQEFRELKFLPEPGCVAVYSSPGWGEAPAIEVVTVTKLCADSTEGQILETVEFPNIRPFSRYYLSPQGDALLIWTRNANSILEFYVYEFGSQEPPRLLLAAEDENWFPGPIRWLPDGQGVEFFAQRAVLDEPVKVLLYASNRQATDIQVKLELQLPFSLLSGDWSPDGRELAFFPGMPRYTPQTSGVYILDLETGEWRLIVSGLYDGAPVIQAWQVEVP